MASKLATLGLCVAAGLCSEQIVELGESAPLRPDGATTGGTPVQQVLALLDRQVSGSLSELQAGEIEKSLDALATGLISGNLRLDERIDREFQGPL